MTQLCAVMRRYRYFAAYKPYGMLSQFTPDHPGQRTLIELAPALPKGVYPVGRLDADSEGLLVLTDDPSLNDRLLRPENRHERTYWAQVEGIPDPDALERLQSGVDIRIRGQHYRTRPARVRLMVTPPDLPPRQPPIRFRKNVPDSWLEITLVEGKNRQVRRMCAAVGFPVLRLVRVQIGALRLGEPPLERMLPGEVRPITIGHLFLK